MMKILMGTLLLSCLSLQNVAAQSWATKVGCDLSGFNRDDQPALQRVYDIIYPPDGTIPYANPDLNKDRSGHYYLRQCVNSSNLAARDICSACSDSSKARDNSALHEWKVYNITGATPSEWGKPKTKTCHDATMLESPRGELYYVDPYHKLCIRRMTVANSGRYTVEGGLPWKVKCFSFSEELEFVKVTDNLKPPDSDAREKDGLPYDDPLHHEIDCINLQCKSLPQIPMTSSIRAGVCEVPSENVNSQVQVVSSIDPNDKVGSRGVSTGQYISGEEPLRYSIFFENVETATAPAQEVVITDQLDTSKIDLNSFSLGPISFGNKQIVPPPGLTEYTTTVDLRPAKQLLVNVEGRLNKTTGLLTWRFTSIDPVTGELPDDPLAGFLPPNRVPPEGDGSVLFTVMPKKGLSTGTQIHNQARVFFDMNAPIDTPQWFNTLDNTKPTSNVLPLPSTQSLASFNVQWQGTDIGSGVLNYTIFVSENGGPFTPWLSNTSATSGTFTGQSGKTYSFYSVAQDKTGNREDPPNEADATTQIVAGADLAITKIVAPNPVLTGSNVTYTITVANNGPGAAADVTVTDNLPASTTFVSCSSTGGGVCGGSGNNRTITFASLAAGMSATITLVANVNCSLANGVAISNTATVSSSTPDPATNNNSATANVTASNPPPVTANPSANPSVLWPPDHRMVDVTVTYSVTDSCGPTTCTLSVSSNEPINGTGDGDTAPDWEIVDANHVRLRAERAGNGAGRIYTITITCRDSAGNSSSKSVTVGVPISQGQN